MTKSQAVLMALFCLFFVMNRSSQAHDHHTGSSGQVSILTAATTGITGDTGPSGATTITWKPLAASPIATFEATGAMVKGKLYRFGGFVGHLQATPRSDVYDPATNSWTQLRNMPEPLTHAPTSVDGTTIYFCGGYVGNHPGPGTVHVWKFETTSGRWSLGRSMPAARGAGGCAILGRDLHYFGGTNGLRTSGLLDTPDHWVLNLDHPSRWRVLAPMPNPRNHMAGVALGGKLYAVGGQHLNDETNSPQNELDVYDPVLNRWSTLAPMPSARGHIQSGTMSIGNYIFVVGGDTFGRVNVAELLSFDPAKGVWATLRLPDARKSAVAGHDTGKIYFTTGATDSGPSNTTYVGTFK